MINMTNLLNNLNELRENNKYLHDMFYRVENDKVVVCLEETFYDYDFESVELMNLLSNYNYEWYNSVEIEVYFN